MSKPLVTVVTATTGSSYLTECLQSVADQTHAAVQHLIFVDGEARREAAEEQLKHFKRPELAVIALPYPTGIDRWNGHRMYAAGTYLAEGEYIMWLDDDNMIEPEHIAQQLENVIKRPNWWSYSLRKIIDSNSNIVCMDDCESLGKWASILSPQDFFVDVNCYFLPRMLAVHMSPVWFRKFREPGQVEIDRAMHMWLRRNQPDFDCTYDYTVRYRAGNTPNSVQKEFFLRGNAAMLEKLEGKLPWKK